MKLLLDENLSFRMLSELEESFPGSDHVTRLGLETTGDRELWNYARDHGFALVTKDSDFHELAALYGSPPKIVWLKCGNQPRHSMTNLLLKHHQQLVAFDQDADTGVAEIANDSE
ncbi:MAG: DUF5615 family PIN-like protein [Gammaproteobacteria bacterium]